MRFLRPTSAALATAVIAASAFTGPASAQAAGVGTSSTSTRVLTAQLGGGEILDLLLLGDEARATNDPAVAAPEAYSRLTALKASTSLIPGSPINIAHGVHEAKSTGPSEVAITGGQLGVPVLPAQLAPVLAGTINPGMLTATVTDGDAAATLNAELTKIDAVGGLVSLGSLKSSMGATSAGSAADAVRRASMSDLKVLDLGAVLAGVGLPLGELTPAQIVALVDGLAAASGLQLPRGADTLADAVVSINAAIDDLQAIVATTPSSTSAVTAAIDTTTDSLLDTIGLTSPVGSTATVEQVVVIVNDLVDELQALIDALLAKGLAALDNTPLLRLEGVEVGVATKAVDDVDASSATVTGRIGKVFVGGIALPGFDLSEPAAKINANVAAINTKIGNALSLVDPGLQNLISVSVLDKATSVSSSEGYTRSRAGVTAASAIITPPANLAALVKAITDQVGVAQALAGSTVKVPVVSSVMSDLGSVLKTKASVLTSPSKVEVAQVLSASDFARAGAAGGGPVGSPTLPRTGGTDLFLFAGVAAVLALAIRRFARVPAVRMARIDE